MNPLELISLALKITGVLGVGQTPQNEDVNDAFTILNSMVSVWNRRRWLIYNLVDISCVSTGAQSYTVGPGQSFDVPRPDQIQSAYVRQIFSTDGNPVDFELAVVNSHEEYGDIALKSLVSFPRFVFYDSAYPIGNLYVYPIPSDLYEVHIILKNTITKFNDLITDINLPPEYQEALIWNLAARLRPMYQLPIDPTVHAIAMQALQVIRGANSQISKLKMPPGLTRQGGAWSSHGIPGIVEGTFTLNESILG